MKLVNTGDEVLRVTGGTADFAGMVMPMETTRKVVNGVEVVGMKGLDFLEVPAHGALVLEPGGDHLMLMNLKTHPGIGDKVKLTLQVEPGHRTVTIEAEVKLDAD
jgi:copper(I)-binding protein